MRVLILSHEYPPYVFGGVVYYTKELAEYPTSQGLVVSVIADRSSKPYVELENNVRIIIRVSIPGYSNKEFLVLNCVEKHISLNISPHLC
ncbi:MAG: hypothetical protein QXH10_10385 [Ignisphaera sp.]